METWLQSIEPRVLEAWLAFYEIEPEAFGATLAGKKQRRMVDARDFSRFRF